MDWQTTIDTIKDEKCILFIGPDIYKSAIENKPEQELLEFLEIEDDKDIQMYKDGLFHFQSGDKKTQLFYKLKRFYQQSFPYTEDLLGKIASIPFHFIISFTPDDKLQEIFQKNKFAFKSHFYFKRKPATKETKIPSKKMPLLYKMMGSLEDQNSLVLTHDDLYDYFESIMQEKSMPTSLKHHIKASKNLIFLGTTFDHWYLQLLLRVLQLHKEEEFIKYATGQPIDMETQAIFKKQFQIEFISENIQEFINTLYTKCEEEGILREKGTADTSSPLTQIRQLVASARVEVAFEVFEEYLNDLGEAVDDIVDRLIVLQGRYNRLVKRVNMGVIEQSKADVNRNEISASLLQLVNEAKDF